MPNNERIIKLGSQILGGVKSAVFYKSSSVKKISEYLTDIPVAKFCESSWKITLKTDGSDSLKFMSGDSFGELSVICGGKTVTYTNCVVKNVSQQLLPQGRTEYTVRLEAETREENG